MASIKTRFALKDAIKITQLNGPIFTRRGKIHERLIQSTLDRIYTSDHGNWLGTVDELRHHTNTVLSDHEPISFEFTLNKRTIQNQQLRSSSYLRLTPPF
jgi:endonuclease/exonuclease/phosphatase family metal-dependent hydrolase